MRKRLCTILFVIYVAFLIVFVVLKFNGSFERIIALRHSIIENEQYAIRNVNLILFKSISPYLMNITEPYAFKNIVGNIVTFIPLGFFVSTIFFRTKFFKTILTCVAIILIIECGQFVLKIGFFDVDDIILNLLGCLLGFFTSLFLFNIRGIRHL